MQSCRGEARVVRLTAAEVFQYHNSWLQWALQCNGRTSALRVVDPKIKCSLSLNEERGRQRTFPEGESSVDDWAP